MIHPMRPRPPRRSFAVRAKCGAKERKCSRRNESSWRGPDRRGSPQPWTSRTPVWTPWSSINPTGSPALATGGTGDILTGLIAGFIAQFPADAAAAVLAGVYLHGKAGEIGARRLGEQSLIATDLLTYLPEAIRVSADR